MAWTNLEVKKYLLPTSWSSFGKKIYYSLGNLESLNEVTFNSLSLTLLLSDKSSSYVFYTMLCNYKTNIISLTVYTGTILVWILTKASWNSSPLWYSGSSKIAERIWLLLVSYAAIIRVVFLSLCVKSLEMLQFLWQKQSRFAQLLKVAVVWNILIERNTQIDQFD